MDRSTAVNELKATWAVLNADLDAAVAYGKQANTPYAQRALTRALFATIEGLSYLLRQVTIATLSDTDILTEGELMLLREETYRLDEKGRPKPSVSYLQFPQSLLFTVRVYAKNHGAEFELDTSMKGWQALVIATKARNRITHPKSSTSLALNNEELQALVDAALWWKSSMLELFTACREADKHWSTQLGHSADP